MGQLATGLLWTGLGILLYQLLPDSWPKKLGRSLYWVGLPLQVLGLAHNSDFSKAPWLPPLIMIAVLGLGLLASALCLQGLKQAHRNHVETQRSTSILTPEGATLLHRSGSLPAVRADFVQHLSRVWPNQRPSQGSFILSSMLGNTIFIGFSIIPSMVNPSYLSWIIIYGIGHSLLGSYGLGVLLANYFGKNQSTGRWTDHIRAILIIPALWGFLIGLLTQSLNFPDILNTGVQFASSLVTPAVFILLGVQLSQFRIANLQVALIPAAIKMCVLPIITGIVLTLLGMQGDARLSLVLMSAMPTSSSNLILAEEFKLDSQLATGSILLSNLSLPLLLPLWINLFH